MSLKQVAMRLVAGLVLILALLVVPFAITLLVIHRWGATGAELAPCPPGRSSTCALPRWPASRGRTAGN